MVGPDAERLLGIIEQRCLTGKTGATWQVQAVHDLSGAADRGNALQRMTQGYIDRMSANEPVHAWAPL